MREVTDLMNAYRECSRNLWNVYFSKRSNIGGALDSFEDIRRMLFNALIVDELSYEGEAESDGVPPVLRVVPKLRALILIERVTGPGQAGYWDQEKDLVVGPDDIKLEFVDYFDFAQIPIKDFRYYLCKILAFPSHTAYVGRKSLLEAADGHVFHDEQADDSPPTR